MLTFKQRLMTVAASVTAVTLAVLPVHAFVREGDEAKTEDAKEAGDRYFAIQGGDIYTGTGEVLRGATLLSKNGKIDQIGYELYLPEGTETLDATGLRLYPGMVALSATANLSQGSFAQGLQLHGPGPLARRLAAPLSHQTHPEQVHQHGIQQCKLCNTAPWVGLSWPCFCLDECTRALATTGDGMLPAAYAPANASCEPNPGSARAALAHTTDVKLPVAPTIRMFLSQL